MRRTTIMAPDDLLEQLRRRYTSTLAPFRTRTRSAVGLHFGLLRRRHVDALRLLPEERQP